MAEHKRYFASKGAQVLPAEASRLIAEQTAAFLKGGGQIQHIPNGVSGQHHYGPRAAPDSAAADTASRPAPSGPG